MGRLMDISGMTFGWWHVVGRFPGNQGGALWNCVCRCGRRRIICSAHLRAGHTKSCGCAPRTYYATHGKSRTPEHAILAGMLSRCQNPKRKSFKHYGGAGVTVSDRWQQFENFLADMGSRPSPRHSIDRIDSSGSYEPSNCRWATFTEQANNRRNTRFVTYRGTRMALTDAVRAAGSVIHYEAAWVRIRTGWSVERALETPRLFVSHASKSKGPLALAVVRVTAEDEERSAA